MKTDKAVNTKHTPGPWTAQTMTGLGGAYNSLPIMAVNGFNGCGVEIASVHKFGEAKHANARLIAAAPDLLAACRAVLEWDEINTSIAINTEGCEVRELLRAAILRATGGK